MWFLTNNIDSHSIEYAVNNVCKHQGSETAQYGLESKSSLNPFQAGNQLNADVLSQSASSNHARLITKSAVVIKKKCPLSQPISIQ